MKNYVIAFILGIAAWAASAHAQSSPFLLPPAIEKDLAARASDVTEVTLDKNMLAFAAKFMNGKDKDDVATQQLIQGLDGIYVRSYEFDKEGQYSMEQIESLRKAIETPEWSPMVRERERKNGETTDIMVKLVNGQPHGLFILSAEPKELSIVLILGPIRMDQLGQLNGLAGIGGALGPLAGVQNAPHGNNGDKAKAKDKKGGGE
jgi:hypothetical protein